MCMYILGLLYVCTNVSICIMSVCGRMAVLYCRMVVLYVCMAVLYVLGCLYVCMY